MASWHCGTLKKRVAPPPWLYSEQFSGKDFFPTMKCAWDGPDEIS